MNHIVRHNPERKLSDAVEYNGVVYLAGQVADDKVFFAALIKELDIKLE